ncbi:hypothetical protein ACFW6S_35095 [Streptomyces sp. NPDC058740]|uniref:hypothetical protein n=1 Tax=Streptomyces sp. NPDC058740 TaxID=3346619 RepID=UPI0036C6A0B5
MDRALDLAGAIMAGVHQDHGADLIRALAPVIVQLKQMVSRRLNDNDLSTATAMALFRAHLAFAGASVWRLAEYDFEDGFYGVGCPHCHHSVTIAIGIYGRYSAHRDWDQGDIRRRPLQQADPSDLDGLAAWMHETARDLGFAQLAEEITWLFGRAECPECASAFVIGDQYAAENEPHHSSDGPVPAGGS